MKVIDLLDAKKNNLDFYRVILAVTIIWSHSAVLNGRIGVWIDPISKLFPFTYSGALAIKIIFFISGLVTMSSIQRDPSVLKFAISRIARIVPGFAVLLIMTVFVIGPTVSIISLRDYFLDPRTFGYLWKNLIFWIQGGLPGVFESNYYPNAVNGSLWSLMYAVGLYIALITLVSLLKNNKKLINLVCTAVILVSLIPNNPFIYILSPNPAINLLPMTFALGIFFSLNSQIIEVSVRTTAASWLLLLFALGTAVEYQFLIFASSMTVLFLSSRHWALALKPRYDISYGTYLWGFLVQQCVVYYLGSVYTWLHFIVAATISMTLGLLSYVLVERRSIELGKYLYKKIRERMSTGQALKDRYGVSGSAP